MSSPKDVINGLPAEKRDLAVAMQSAADESVGGGNVLGLSLGFSDSANTVVYDANDLYLTSSGVNSQACALGQCLYSWNMGLLQGYKTNADAAFSKVWFSPKIAANGA